MNRLILASGSPRRKELLSSLHIPFEIISADINETIDTSKDLEKEIERLSFEKALAVFKDNKDAVVIGADTIVTIDNKVLGKPKTKEEAITMLKELEGRVHKVITGVTILSLKESETFSRTSLVHFNHMSDEEIIDYVNTNEPLDKAGAYAIQGEAAKYIDGIEGDYYTIVGFPISEIYTRLKKY